MAVGKRWIALGPTPRIDSIARDGVALVNGYAGNATYAPSRAAIVTDVAQRRSTG